MRRHWMLRVVKFLAFAALAVVVLGYVVMSLWNRLLPGLFGWHVITFWQAVGLLILSRIFFGGLRRGGWGPGMHWRRRMMERWEKMTPEEREKFRAGMRGCGPFGAPTPPATEAKS
jgi:Ca2+/H+ antiporter, TMEM165/GDT1 family